MLKIVIGVLALFPWSLLVVFILGAARRRAGRKLFTGEYIPAPMPGPIVLDSAQVAKALREYRQ